MTTGQEHATAFRAVVQYAGTASPLAVVARRISALADATVIARENVVADMRADHWTWQEIADAFGITHQAARTWARAHGIK